MNTTPRMTASELPHQQQTFQNPLEGVAGAVMFSLLVLSQFAIAFILCTTVPVPPAIRELIPKSLLILGGLGWYSFAIADSGKSKQTDANWFFPSWIALTLFFAPIACMILIDNVYCFWASLIVANLWAAWLALSQRSNISFWDNLACFIYIFWVVTCVVITSGTTEYFPFAKLAISMEQLRNLIDLRLLITAVLFSVFAAKAVWRAILQGKPNIPSIPDLTFPDIPKHKNASFLEMVFRPFIIVLNGLLRLIQSIVDVVWKLCALITTYLGRFGANLANQFFDLITETTTWVEIIRVLITFHLVVAFTYATSFILPHVGFYLTSSHSFTSLTWNDPISDALKWIIGFFFVTLAGILLTSWIWRFREFAHKAIFGGSMIVVASVLAGGLMYGTARISIFQLTGFRSLGVFSFVMLIIVGLVFLVQVVRRLVQKHDSTYSTVEDPIPNFEMPPPVRTR